MPHPKIIFEKCLEGKESLYYLCTRKRQERRRKRAGQSGAGHERN